MKFSGGGNSEILCGGGPVDTLLLTSCWGGGGGGSGTDHFLMDTPAHKLVMDSCSTTDEDSATKATMDALDSLLLTSSSSQNSPPGSNSNFAELKPLPPFTGYTGHLSINGIPGHHFHAIAAPQSPQSPHNTVSSLVETNNNNAHTTNHNTNNNVVFKAGNNNGSTTLYYTVSTTADQSVVSSSTVDGVSGGIKPEFVDYSLLPPEIEDIAAIIGSAIADTTVPNVDGLVGPGDDPAASRDSWMDLDAWIDTACGENNVQNGGGGGKAIISAESLQEFVANSQFVVSVNPDDCVTTGPSSTLQSLLTQGLQQQQQAFTQQAALLLKRDPSTTNTANYQHQHMPLLQNRLQNGPPSMSNGAIKPESTSTYLSECPSPSSSTPYLSNKEMILPHTTTGSPPGHVVSTTDNTLLMNGGRYQSVHQRNRPGYSHIRSLKTGGVPSPDLLVNGGSLDSLVTGSSLVHGNYPHTTAATTTTPSPSKSKSRSRSGRKQHSGGGGGGGGGGGASVIYTADGSGGMIGKEKPVHRCTICNRGFLNKSNIKVHLRTHTGEKPFRCEVCGKAFRQKAHLIKHQQIHKRVGRD